MPFADYIAWGIHHKPEIEDAVTHAAAIESDVAKMMADFPAHEVQPVVAACHACLATTDHATWLDSHPFIKQLVQTYGMQAVQALLPYILKYLQPATA